MGSKGRLLVYLNEPSIENEDHIDNVVCFQPQEASPTSSITKTDLFVASADPQGISNNHASSHASSVSGFQPFVRIKPAQGSDASAQNRGLMDIHSSIDSSSIKINGQGVRAAPDLAAGPVGAQDSEKEEGEWSDAEGSANACRSVIHDSSGASDKHVQERGQAALMENSACPKGVESIALDTNNVKNMSISSVVLDPETTVKKIKRSKDGEEDSASEPRPRTFRGNEANHALRSVNNLGKRPKPYQRKEVMLGKKRGRQTMYLDLEDVKQVGALKTPTPRKQIPAPTLLRAPRETHSAVPSADSEENQTQPVIQDTKQGDSSTYEGNDFVESNDYKTESNENSNSGTPGPSGMLNSSIDRSSELQTPLVSRQSSWKQPPNTKQLNQLSGRKPAVYSSTDTKLPVKRITSKKQIFVNQYQDSSVERLLREVTSEKFWNHPGNVVFHVHSCTILCLSQCL